MSTLHDRLSETRSRLHGVPKKLGLPKYSHTVVLDPPGSSPDIPASDAKVVNVSSRYSVGDYLTDNIQITGKELIVTLPRVPRYPIEQVRKSRYLIDGVSHVVLWVNEDKSTVYEVLVTPKKQL